MSRHNLAWLLGIAAVSLLGVAIAQTTTTPDQDRDYRLVRLFVDVLNQVKQRYVVELDPEKERKLVEDMINGGLERLDPHSAFIGPKELKQFNKQSDGKFGGVGIQVGYDRQNRGYLTVISPIVGTPAYKKGIRAGDIIVKIDGKATANMVLNDAVELITGEPGTEVTLTVRHEDEAEPIDIPLTRAIIQVPCVLGDRRKKGPDGEEWELMFDAETKIGYIRLTNFGKNSGAEMRKAVEDLQAQGVRGLIIDLRNNPGGLLRASVEIADLFLSEGRIVSTKGRNHAEEAYDAHAPGTLLVPGSRYPIAVLINRNSASASEILSAALQDHKRAVIIGERSYGKGSVQNIIDMENRSSALKLTTASYWRPSGKNIHRFPDSKDTDEWGVKPDIEVTLDDQERARWMIWRSDRDVVRDGEKKKPDEKKPDEKKSEEKKPEEKKPDEAKPEEKKPFTDRVLDKALEVIKKELAKPAAE